MNRSDIEPHAWRDAYRVALSDALRPLADPADVQATAVRVLGTWLCASRAYYVEVEPDETHVVCTSDYTDGAPSVVGRYRLDDFSPYILTEYRAGRHVAFADTSNDPRVPPELRAAWARIHIRAHVAVPLVKASRFVAALGVDHTAPRAWTDAEIALIEETAERTWAAVERARADTLVRRSHDTFLAMIEQNPLGVFLVDSALRLAQVSAGGRRLFSGVDPLVGRDLGAVLRQIWPGAVASEVMARFRRTLATGEPHHSPETTVKRIDNGLVESYDWQIQRALLPDGHFGVVCYFYDTTSQVQAAQEARFLAALAEQIRLGENADELLHGATALLTGYLRADRASFSEASTSRDQRHLAPVCPQATSVTAAPHDPELSPDQQQLLEAGRVLVVTAAPTPPCGFIAVPLRRHREWVATCTVSADRAREWTPREVRLAEIVAERAWNAAERLRGEVAKRASDERYRSIVNQTVAGIAEVDLTGRFLAVNERYARITGYSPAELQARRMQDITHPEDLPVNLDKFTALLQDGTPFEIEKRYVRPNGTAVWVHNTVSIFRDATGSPQSVLAVSIDITERRSAEAALLEEARRKDQFLAMLAHELRNPLAPIRHAAHLLNAVDVDYADVQRVREVIERQVQHLTRLVDDLLDVSRITRGKVTLRRELVNISTVVARAVEMTRPLIEARGHAVQLDGHAEVLQVEGDPTRLVQVVANLLHNAAKFTDDGGQLSITVRRSVDEVVISVRDNGIGVPEDLLPHIFGVFTQAERSLDRSQGGLGIGLTLVRQLVEMHGGRVEARSDGPRRGSEFVVTLPLAMQADLSVAEAMPSGIHPSASPRLRVLVVEDFADSAEMLTLILTQAGHETRTAGDGFAALDAAARFQPHVVLCDIGLPGLSGYEVARLLRERSECSHTRLIAVSGYGQSEDKQRAREAGFDDHLTKPVEPAALTALLASLSRDDTRG